MQARSAKCYTRIKQNDIRCKSSSQLEFDVDCRILPESSSHGGVTRRWEWGKVIGMRTRTRYMTGGRGEAVEAGVVSNRRPTENWCVDCVEGKERNGMGGVCLCTRRGFASRLRSVLRSRCRCLIAENASLEPLDAGTVLPFE